MNRRAITEAAQREIDRMRRGDAPVMLVLVDLDRFSASVDALVAQADAALYAAKRGPRPLRHPQGHRGLHVRCK